MDRDPAGHTAIDPVTRELSQELFRLGPFAQAVSMLAGLFLAVALSPVVETPLLLIWYLALVATSVFRIYLVMVQRRDAGDRDMDLRLLRLYRVGIVLSASVWGAAPLLTWPTFELEYLMMTAMVLAGMTAGAVTVLAALRGMYLLFAVPALAPVTMVLLFQVELTAGIAGLLILFFIFSMRRVERDLYGILHRNVELSLSNQEVNSALTEMNSLLQAEADRREQDAETAERRAAALRALYRESSDITREFRDTLSALLQIGADFYGLSHGSVSRIRDGEYRVVAAVNTGSGEPPAVGTKLPLGDTVCARTIRRDLPYSFYDVDAEQVELDPELKKNCKAYIGARIYRNDEPYGTVAFYGGVARIENFTSEEKDFILLIAGWISGELNGQYLREVQRRTAAELELITDSVDAGILYLDDSMVVRYANRRYRYLVGREDQDVNGMRIDQVIGEENAAEVIPYIRRCLAGERVQYEAERTYGSMRRHIHQVRVLPDQREGEDRVRGCFALVSDITELRRAQDSLRHEKEVAQATLGSVVEGVIRCDEHGRIDFMNRSAESLLATQLVAARDVPLAELIDCKTEEGKPLVPQMLTSAAEGLRYTSQKDHWLKRSDGTGVWLQATALPLKGDLGEVRQVLVLLRDVTKERRLIDELSRDAAHDALTGLKNRRELERRLARAVEESNRSNVSYALLFLDLDGFKDVNDTAGHLVGDQLLVEVARALRHAMRREDLLARIGGDEFAVLARDCDAQVARRIGDKLREVVSGARIRNGGIEFQVGVSIGVAIVSDDGATPKDIIGLADGACYAAKRAGRDQVVLARPEGLAH